MRNLILTITLFLSCTYAQKKTTEQYLDGRTYKILHQTVYFEDGVVNRNDLRNRNTEFKFKVLGEDRVFALFNIGDHSGYFKFDMKMSECYDDKVQHTKFYTFKSYFEGRSDSIFGTFIVANLDRKKKTLFMFTLDRITTVFELEFIKMEEK